MCSAGRSPARKASRSKPARSGVKGVTWMPARLLRITSWKGWPSARHSASSTRAVDQRRAVVGHQAVQALLRAAADLRLVVARKVAEGTVDPAVRVEPAGDAQRVAQLLEVVLVAERGVLVEPLRRHQLGRHALGLRAVVQADARAHEGLRRGGERDHAEAEGHAQLDVALEQLDRFDGEQRCAALIPCPAVCRCAACRRRRLPASSCPACAGAAGRSGSCRPCAPARPSSPPRACPGTPPRKCRA